MQNYLIKISTRFFSSNLAVEFHFIICNHLQLRIFTSTGCYWSSIFGRGKAKLGVVLHLNSYSYVLKIVPFCVVKAKYRSKQGVINFVHFRFRTTFAQTAKCCLYNT